MTCYRRKQHRTGAFNMFLKPLKTLEFAVTVLVVRHPVHRVLHALAFGYFGSGSFSNPMPSRPVGSKNAGVAKGYAALWTGYPRLARRRKMQVHSLCGLAFGCHKGLLHCYEPRLVVEMRFRRSVSRHWVANLEAGSRCCSQRGSGQGKSEGSRPRAPAC